MILKSSFPVLNFAWIYQFSTILYKPRFSQRNHQDLFIVTTREVKQTLKTIITWKDFNRQYLTKPVFFLHSKSINVSSAVVADTGWVGSGDWLMTGWSDFVRYCSKCFKLPWCLFWRISAICKELLKMIINDKHFK